MPTFKVGDKVMLSLTSNYREPRYQINSNELKIGEVGTITRYEPDGFGDGISNDHIYKVEFVFDGTTLDNIYKEKDLISAGKVFHPLLHLKHKEV